MSTHAMRAACWGTVLLLSAAGTLAAVADDLRLVQAVERQDANAVRALLAEQVDVNETQPDGATAIHWAAHRDDLDTAELLIRAGADVTAANVHGVTPLSLACANANGEMVALLLEAGADPNAARVSGETPLMRAASTGSVDAVEALLAAGADVHAADPVTKQTALMWAASRRHADVARVLVGQGAEVGAQSRDGFTPLLFAAREGTVETARVLLDAGADVNQVTPDGTSALIVATVRGHVPVAVLLLDEGADPNAGPIVKGRDPFAPEPDSDAAAEADEEPEGPDYTPLHWAAGAWQTELSGPNGIAAEREDEWRAIRGVPAGKLELVRALLAHGADPNARIRKIPPRFGYSQLSYEHNKQGVKVFDGATPLLLAAMAGDVEVMRLLAELGADAHLATRDGTTPLMVAAGLGRYQAESLVTERRTLDSVALAMELGAEVNAVNEVGNTALHAAAHIKSDALVQYLVDRGAEVNMANARGETPLIVADRFRAGSANVTVRTSTGDLLRRLGARDDAAAGEQSPK